MTESQSIHLTICVVQILQAVVERVQDFEDKVRSRAIGAICEAAIAHPEVILTYLAYNVCSVCSAVYLQPVVHVAANSVQALLCIKSNARAYLSSNFLAACH